MRFQIDLFAEPPMYGAEPGHNVTASGHAAETATITSPASASWRTRTASRGAPATRYAATSAGRPMSQIESGGLSTVMKRPGSSEPKNQAFRLTLADFTAAA